MKKILILPILLFLVSSLYGQRFQASLSSEHNKLLLNLSVVEGNFEHISFSQIEFFIRTSSSSHLKIGDILVDETNFPGNIPITLISGKIKGEYRIFHFGYPSTPSIVKRSYYDTSSYRFASINLVDVEEGELLELVANTETYETYLNLTSGKGEDLASVESEEELIEGFFTGEYKQKQDKVYTQGTRISLQEANPVNLLYSTDNVEVELYPNPVVERVNLQIDSEKSERVELIIQDIQGKILLSKLVDLEQGLNQIDWLVKTLAAGNYVLVAKGQDINFSHKLTVVK